MSQNPIIKKSYKQTEIGVIPEDWEVCELGSLSKIIMGQSPLSKYYNILGDGLPLIQGNADIKNRRTIIRNYTKQITKQSKKGSIILTVRAPVGEVGITEFDCCLGRGVCSLSYPNNYLYQYLLFIEKLWAKYSAGSTFDSINGEQINGVKIAIPKSKDEQSAIASILSDTDALIESLDKLIEKKKAIKQGTMQELLTGKRRLPGFSGEWKERKLGDICEIKKGQLITETTRIDGDIPVIAGGKKPAYYHIKANRKGKTITISGSGASAGFVAYHTYPIFASDCSTIEESSNYSVEYIYHCLQLQQLEIYKRQTGGAQPHIHPSDLKPILVQIPSLENQEAIGNILSKMDDEIDLLEHRRDKLQKVKQGMMQQLLTGNIRVYGK